MKTLNPVKLSCIVTAVYVIITLHSCSLLGPKEQDCYDIGRELTDEEKNIFPYKVGDSVFFTDGEKDYYIYCSLILDTINTLSRDDDYDCKGEIDQTDEYIRYIVLKTNLPLYNDCKEFWIGISPERVAILLYKYTGDLGMMSNYDFGIATEKIVNTIKTNNDIHRIYIDSISVNNNWYYDIYKISTFYENMTVNLDTCYINGNDGFVKLILNENQIIEIK